jgi:hypothetical protein
MTWPLVTDAQSAVQLMMGIGCTLVGLSHVLQPRAWQEYFAALHKQGAAGALTRTMTWELWPALILVTVHQVWSGPAVLLTLYGWLLLIKCTISLVVPQVSLRFMVMAQRGPATFVAGGCLLIGIGLASASALIWR